MKKLVSIIAFFAIIGVNTAFSQTTGEYVFRTNDGKTVPVRYVLPPDVNNESGVMIAMHGLDRPRDFALWFRSLSLVANIAVAAPELDVRQFPTALYQRIGIPNNINRPQNWTTKLIDEIFVDFVRRFELTANKYILYGQSAGGQFTQKALMFSESDYLEYAIAANPGVLTFPDMSINFPHGIRDLTVHRNLINNNFNRRFYLLTGNQDNDPNHPSLDTGNNANRQGAHRHERALNFFAASRNYARENNLNFNWELVVMDGVGHGTRPSLPWVLNILTGNTGPSSPAAINQLSGQERIYGTWYANNNSAVFISGDTMIWLTGSNRRVVGINSFTQITNTNAETRDNYPNGFRIRGVYTETDRSGTSVGDDYNLPWFISVDNLSIIQGSGASVIYNRY